MITIDDLIEWRKREIWERLDTIALQKGHDYSGTKGDTFKNIRLNEHILGMPAEIACLVRLNDKFSRMGTLLVGGWKDNETAAVKDESVEDTVLDAINYLTYILALRAERRNGGILPGGEKK
jgi:hypothetical protein